MCKYTVHFQSKFLEHLTPTTLYTDNSGYSVSVSVLVSNLFIVELRSEMNAYNKYAYLDAYRDNFSETHVNIITSFLELFMCLYIIKPVAKGWW